MTSLSRLVCHRVVSSAEDDDDQEQFWGPPCHEAQSVLEPEVKCKGIKLASKGNVESADLILPITKLSKDLWARLEHGCWRGPAIIPLC